MIVEAMQPLDVGDILTYQQIADALEEPEWRNTFRTSFYKAANVWGEEHHRAFRAVPNVGYRVVEAAEHEALGTDWLFWHGVLPHISRVFGSAGSG